MKSFLSSTFIDLKDHRLAAGQALERLGNEIGRMEVFGARPQEAAVASIEEVEDCDLFVGIYAHRYGHIPVGSKISITEQEFDHAVKCNKPIFCFYINDDYPWPPKLIEGEPGRTRLSVFKQRASELVTRDIFTTPQDLAMMRVATSVGHHLWKWRLDDLTSQLRRSMGAAELNTQNLARGRSLRDVSNDAREEVKRLVSDLIAMTDKLPVDRPTQNAEMDPNTILTLAQGLMAERKWVDAGRKYEEFAKLKPDNWEANYLRGVAFANSREGSATNIAALRAVNDAIVFAPADIEGNVRARLFSYRGAMLKRLGRLEEAESDLLFAKRFAARRYETDDILYNLAGVYAQRGARDKLFQAIQEISDSSPHFDAIRGHLDDYFRSFRDDPEFLALIRSPSQPNAHWPPFSPGK